MKNKISGGSGSQLCPDCIESYSHEDCLRSAIATGDCAHGGMRTLSQTLVTPSKPSRTSKRNQALLKSNYWNPPQNWNGKYYTPLWKLINHIALAVHVCLWCQLLSAQDLNGHPKSREASHGDWSSFADARRTFEATTSVQNRITSPCAY